MRFAWKALRQDGIAVGALLALLLALVFGSWNAARARELELQRWTTLQQFEVENLDGLREQLEGLEAGGAAPPSWVDPRWPVVVATQAARPTLSAPPGPLAVLGMGAPGINPLEAKPTLGGPEPEYAAEELANPESLLAGRFDPVFVVVFLLPLVAIALAFDLLARDRARGILPLALACAPSAWSVYAPHYAVRALALLATLWLGTGIGLLAFGFDASSPGALSAVALWLMLASLHGLVWIAACASLAPIGVNGTVQALWLVALWVAGTAAVPAVVGPLLELSVKSPSRATSAHLARDASWKSWDEKEQRTSRLLMQHPEMRPVSSSSESAWREQLETLAYHSGMAEATAPLLQELERSAQQRQRRAALTAWFSPNIALLSALDELTGTGPAARQDFRQQARDFQAIWNTHFIAKIHSGQPFTAADVASIPRFSLDALPKAALSAAVLQASARPALILLLWSILLAALGYRQLRFAPMLVKAGG
jgi:ABC-2 type transport system permease protein